MILSNKCSCGPCLFLFRSISTHSTPECNHYKVLGLNSSATQSEIKSAFYELCKKHHPDKNQGCEKSAKKFKDINAAYEVLRNKKLRLLYDKELFTRKMANSTTVNSRVDYNDEVERSFYERTSKLKYKRYYGKTKYYDFELWYKCHYQNPTPYKTYQNRNPYQYTWVKNNLEPNVKPRIHVMYLSLGGVIIMFYYYFMH